MAKKHTIAEIEALLIQSHLDDKADTLDDFSAWLERQMDQAVGDVSQASKLADLLVARMFLSDFKYRRLGGKNDQI